MQFKDNQTHHRMEVFFNLGFISGLGRRMDIKIKL